MHAFREAHRVRDAKKQIDLRDADGERIIAGRRQSGRPISESALRQEVGDDLQVLFNTIALGSTVDLSGLEQVRGSILNFGLPDIAHRSFEEAGVDDISEEIRAALVRFEPRLLPDTIHVSRDTSADPAALKVRFVVRAVLRCEPADVGVEFVTNVDLDTGRVVPEPL